MKVELAKATCIETKLLKIIDELTETNRLLLMLVRGQDSVPPWEGQYEFLNKTKE